MKESINEPYQGVPIPKWKIYYKLTNTEAFNKDRSLIEVCNGATAEAAIGNEGWRCKSNHR